MPTMLWRRRQRREHDLDRELRAHLELEAEEQQEEVVVEPAAVPELVPADPPVPGEPCLAPPQPFSAATSAIRLRMLPACSLARAERRASNRRATSGSAAAPGYATRFQTLLVLPRA